MIKKIRLISKSMPSQLGLKTIVIDLLINISKSRDNHFQPIFAMDLNTHEIG